MQTVSRSAAGSGRAPIPAPPPVDTERLSDFRTWKDFVHDHFPWLEHRDDSHGGFEAEVSVYHVGYGTLNTIRAGASEVVRTRHLAEASEAGFIKLMWQISGQMRIEQDDRSSTVCAGQATVCDTARCYRIQLSEQAYFAVFTLPYDACPGWQRISQKICGTRLAEGPTVRAAFGALMGLTALPHDPQDSGNQTVVQAVQWLLSASLHRAARDQGLSTIRCPRLCRAQAYVLEHLSDPGLDANDIARALCMSRRSLYLLFKERGLTPARMIHDLRLEQGTRMLGDPGQSRRKITDIAFDLGFSDYATFSRLFKARYGVTPSEYRSGARPLPG